MTDADDDNDFHKMHRDRCQDIDGSGACFGCGQWLEWKPSKAVLVRVAEIGCILWTTSGSLIESLADSYISVNVLSDIGLDYAPEGLSIWEGDFKWIGSWEPFGSYRDVTDLEWQAIKAKRSPFEEGGR